MCFLSGLFGLDGPSRAQEDEDAVDFFGEAVTAKPKHIRSNSTATRLFEQAQAAKKAKAVPNHRARANTMGMFSQSDESFGLGGPRALRPNPIARKHRHSLSASSLSSKDSRVRAGLPKKTSSPVQPQSLSESTPTQELDHPTVPTPSDQDVKRSESAVIPVKIDSVAKPKHEQETAPVNPYAGLFDQTEGNDLTRKDDYFSSFDTDHSTPIASNSLSSSLSRPVATMVSRHTRVPSEVEDLFAAGPSTALSASNAPLNPLFDSPVDSSSPLLTTKPALLANTSTTPSVPVATVSPPKKPAPGLFDAAPTPDPDMLFSRARQPAHSEDAIDALFSTGTRAKRAKPTKPTKNKSNSSSSGEAELDRFGKVEGTRPASKEPTPDVSASVPVQLCEECEDGTTVALVTCDPCGQSLCAECDQYLHRKGKRKTHQRVALQPATSGAVNLSPAGDLFEETSSTREQKQDKKDVNPYQGLFGSIYGDNDHDRSFSALMTTETSGPSEAPTKAPNLETPLPPAVPSQLGVAETSQSNEEDLFGADVAGAAEAAEVSTDLLFGGPDLDEVWSEPRGNTNHAPGGKRPALDSLFGLDEDTEESQGLFATSKPAKDSVGEKPLPGSAKTNNLFGPDDSQAAVSSLFAGENQAADSLFSSQPTNQPNKPTIPSPRATKKTDLGLLFSVDSEEDDDCLFPTLSANKPKKSSKPLPPSDHGDHEPEVLFSNIIDSPSIPQKEVHEPNSSVEQTVLFAPADSSTGLLPTEEKPDPRPLVSSKALSIHPKPVTESPGQRTRETKSKKKKQVNSLFLDDDGASDGLFSSSGTAHMLTLSVLPLFVCFTM